MRIFNAALTIFFCLLITACGGGSDNSDNTPSPTPSPSPVATPTPTPTVSPTPTITPTPGVTPTPGGNQNPLADAGDNQSVLAGSAVNLDGSASSDPDGEITGYLWQQTSGEAIELTNANTAVAQFTAPQVTTTTQYIFQLTVTDNQQATATDTVTVTVNPPVSPGVSGLEARPVNATCLAGDAPDETSSIDVERVFPALSFISPVALLQAPGDNSRWFILEKSGRILAFDNSSSVTTVSEFADLTDRVDSSASESGLLAMAFHPDFNTNGEVFLYYQGSEPGGGCCVNQLVRYTSGDDGATLDPGSAEVLISFTHPFENHFGGQLGFDEEGMLYLSIGDGGSGHDPHERAQDTSNIWGSILRLNIDSGSPYSIPPENPFASETALCNSDSAMTDRTAACPEIYAWGLRNPWRWSFDRATGDLWLADVGQDEWEEVNIIQQGGNYGWDIREGAHCHEPTTGCITSGLIDPVAEVAQPELQSITGGYVYRGSNIPALVGKYLFSDYRTGPIYALAADGNGGWAIEKLLEDTGFNTASFAEDQFGELYVLTYGGSIYRIIAGTPTSGPQVPLLLSETGCVDPEDPTQPASGLIPYDINAGFWSDGAVKQRWLALPEGQQVSIDEQQDWQLPVGSVLMKSFWLNDRLIETRLFKHHNDGTWAGYTYAWNTTGNDASLVRGGAVVNIDGQNWIYPSGNQCMECHTEAAGRALGPETAQVNKPFTYPQTGITANQLTTLESIGVLNESPQDIALANPYDAASPLEARARAYLHTNCSQCHRPGGNINLDMDLRNSTSLADMNICDVEPQNGNMGIATARRLAPGDADRSVLLARMNLRNDALQMPPIGSNVVDTEGVALIREWISSLPENACQ